MTLRVDVDHIRRILTASLPAGARAAELFIESRLSLHVGLTGSGTARLGARGAAPIVERLWETGAHLRRFSEGRHESFVLDAPTPESLEALALHPEAVAVEWLTGTPPIGVTREVSGRVPIEARLSDASPSSTAGPWSAGFLSTASELLSSWLRSVETGLPAGQACLVSATLDASLQEILVLATDRDPARDTRSFVDATLRVSLEPGPAGPGHFALEETRSARSLEELLLMDRDVRHPAALLPQRAERGAGATAAPRGEMPVVFASPSGGFLLHEVCGHLLEADHVLRGVTPFATARGRAIASPLLTLADDGSITSMRGSALFDDEGVAARRSPLIIDGTLVGYLSDRITAVATDGISTGNGRRQSYRDTPMPRMTNLVIDPGQETFDQILRRTPGGLLVTRLGRGRVDPATGLFALAVAEGFRIEAGRVGASVAGAVLRGRAADLLEAIDAVGCDAAADTGAPMCVKEDQALPFGILQPTLRVSSMMVSDQ